MRVHLAGDVDFVLDRDRHAEQRPLLAGLQPRLGLLGFEQRPLGEDLAEGVQLRVEALDPLQAACRTSSVGETSPARTISACFAGAGEGDVVVSTPSVRLTATSQILCASPRGAVSPRPGRSPGRRAERIRSAFGGLIRTPKSRPGSSACAASR